MHHGNFGGSGVGVPRMHPVAIRVQCCARDEGRPPGGGVQTQPSNYPELLPLRAVVVSVREKAQSDASCMCCEDERE